MPPSCGEALHRADEIENPLQGGNGDVAIPLRRTRAHGEKSSRLLVETDSTIAEIGKTVGIRRARRIHGGVPEGQGLHAYAVQKRALAPDRLKRGSPPPPTKPIASASRLKSRAACSARKACPSPNAKHPSYLPVILPGSRGSFSRRLHCGPRSCSRAGVSPSQPPSTRPRVGAGTLTYRPFSRLRLPCARSFRSGETPHLGVAGIGGDGARLAAIAAARCRLPERHGRPGRACRAPGRSSCAVALGRLTCSGRRAPRRSFVSVSVPPAPEAIRQAAEGVP